MTRQNWIHKYVRESEQFRKDYLRHVGCKKRGIRHKNRKWWNAWYKTWEHDFAKQTEGEE